MTERCVLCTCWIGTNCSMALFSTSQKALHRVSGVRYSDISILTRDLLLSLISWHHHLQQTMKRHKIRFSWSWSICSATRARKKKFQLESIDKFYGSLNETVCQPQKDGHEIACSTYICERTFSTMNINKSKLRSSPTDVHVQSLLRISTSELQPDFGKLVDNFARSQMSHWWLTSVSLKHAA